MTAKFFTATLMQDFAYKWAPLMLLCTILFLAVSYWTDAKYPRWRAALMWLALIIAFISQLPLPFAILVQPELAVATITSRPLTISRLVLMNAMSFLAMIVYMGVNMRPNFGLKQTDFVSPLPLKVQDKIREVKNKLTHKNVLPHDVNEYNDKASLKAGDYVGYDDTTRIDSFALGAYWAYTQTELTEKEKAQLVFQGENVEQIQQALRTVGDLRTASTVVTLSAPGREVLPGFEAFMNDEV
ncbi:hypothetical protein ACFQY8_07675 [Alloscardovia venturai]|uniref:Uncharacterized protein n=1 Tax=Alloscardovia venturai TaxID=1769421 RepID=A0ABW2Y8L8_9BIFI